MKGLPRCQFALFLGPGPAAVKKSPLASLYKRGVFFSLNNGNLV
jgi:hypothetical protein